MKADLKELMSGKLSPELFRLRAMLSRLIVAKETPNGWKVSKLLFPNREATKKAYAGRFVLFLLNEDFKSDPL